jgi:hypothetical protein
MPSDWVVFTDFKPNLILKKNHRWIPAVVYTDFPKGLSLLLFLLNMQGMLAKSWTKLLNSKLFTAGLASERVVVIACFLADQVNNFDFLLAFGHY